MTLRSQLYLLQLEDYNLARWRAWIKNNPGREVLEKKGKINWTLKAKILFLLSFVVGLPWSVVIFSPFDWLAKWLVVGAARLKLATLRNLTVIGVVGSWGKTTTKDHLAVMLEQKYRVFKTAGNNNTLLGVAFTVLKMPSDTQIFVCEMGEYYPGDIRDICRLVRPKIGITTAVGPMHLERFGTMELLEKTLREIEEFAQFIIQPGQDSVNILAKQFGVTVPKSFPVLPHRLEVKVAGEITIIDDSYNSNPEGFKIALAKLKEITGRPKILVTPGMIEMGHVQHAMNKKAAALAAKVCDEIIIVGETNKAAWVEGLDKKKYFLASNFAEAQRTMLALAKPAMPAGRQGAVILLENDLPDQYF